MSFFADEVIENAFGGTLVYTAPELLKHNIGSRASDVYSFALTAYQVS